MESAKALIDKAANVCGSRYALAKRLGVHDSALANMHAGDRPIPAHIAARIAAIAGDDPTTAALDVVVSHAKPEHQAELRRLFKMAHAAGVAAIAIGMGLAALPAQRAEAHNNAPHNEGIPGPVWHYVKRRNQARRLAKRLLKALHASTAFGIRRYSAA